MLQPRSRAIRTISIRTRLETEKVRPSYTTSRSARLGALSATNRSASPLPSQSETKTESTSVNTHKEASRRNNNSTSSSSSSRASPSTHQVRRKPKVEVKAQAVSQKFTGKPSPKGSAFQSPADSTIAENTTGSSSKKPSDNSPSRSRVSDHPAMLAKRGIVSPKRTHSKSVPNVSRQFPSEQRNQHVNQRASAPKVDTGFERTLKDGEKQDTREGRRARS